MADEVLSKGLVAALSFTKRSLGQEDIYESLPDIAKGGSSSSYISKEWAHIYASVCGQQAGEPSGKEEREAFSNLSLTAMSHPSSDLAACTDRERVSYSCGAIPRETPG